MARQAITEVRKSGRARLEWSLPLELKTALAHASADTGKPIAVLLEEAARAHPAVVQWLPKESDKSQVET